MGWGLVDGFKAIVYLPVAATQAVVRGITSGQRSARNKARGEYNDAQRDRDVMLH